MKALSSHIDCHSDVTKFEEGASNREISFVDGFLDDEEQLAAIRLARVDARVPMPLLRPAHQIDEIRVQRSVLFEVDAKRGKVIRSRNDCQREPVAMRYRPNDTDRPDRLPVIADRDYAWCMAQKVQSHTRICAAGTKLMLSLGHCTFERKFLDAEGRDAVRLDGAARGCDTGGQ